MSALNDFGAAPETSLCAAGDSPILIARHHLETRPFRRALTLAHLVINAGVALLFSAEAGIDRCFHLTDSLLGQGLTGFFGTMNSRSSGSTKRLPGSRSWGRGFGAASQVCSEAFFRESERCIERAHQMGFFTLHDGPFRSAVPPTARSDKRHRRYRRSCNYVRGGPQSHHGIAIGVRHIIFRAVRGYSREIKVWKSFVNIAPRPLIG